MVNLLNYSHTALQAYLTSIGEAPYRATQLFQWIHQVGETDFSKMTNLSKACRQTLAEQACIALPEVVTTQQATDGTCKWLLRLSCGNCIETVWIPEKTRGTLCVSSQVGCGLTCSFCSTAKQGFNRDLTVAEIIGQVWLAVRLLSRKAGAHDHQVTNVVMMGMGEPLLNYDAVIAAMAIMMDDFAYGLSKRRVTLSTSGLVPQMLRLKGDSPVALAVSLHAPTDPLRNELVPINKKYPLAELMAVCRTYFPAFSRRCVTFEYVMLKGVNDQPSHARDLVKLVASVPCKINLIPFNPFPYAPYQRSEPEVIEQFKAYLLLKGIPTTIRKTRGEDIDGACGQLAGALQDITSRSNRWQRLRGIPIHSS